MHIHRTRRRHPYLLPYTFVLQHRSVHPKLVVSWTCLIPKSECVKFLGTFVPQQSSAHSKLDCYLNPPTNLQYSYSHSGGGATHEGTWRYLTVSVGAEDYSAAIRSLPDNMNRRKFQSHWNNIQKTLNSASKVDRITFATSMAICPSESSSASIWANFCFENLK